MQVPDGPALPSGGDLDGVRPDDLGVRGNAVAKEGGLGKTALAHVEGLLGSQEAMAEHISGTLHDKIAVVVRCVFEEQIRDEIGVVDLVDVAAEGGVVVQVAELAGGGEHEVSGVLPEGLA